MLDRLAAEVFGPPRVAPVEQLGLGQQRPHADFDRDVRRQVGGMVGPGRERRLGKTRSPGPEHDAERARPRLPRRPSFPQPRANRGRVPRLRGVADPQQLDVGVAKEEPSARGALPAVLVRRTFTQPHARERLRFGRILRAADKDVVECVPHGLRFSRGSTGQTRSGSVRLP